MSGATVGKSGVGMPAGSWWIPTSWAFVLLATANLGAALYLNVEVLTDEVYRLLLADRGSTAQVESVLAVTRRWEILGYVLGPITLFVRIGIMALLVQLCLVLLGTRTPLSHVFRAATWAQFAALLGIFSQSLVLATLPPVGRTPDQLQTMPGSLIGVFRSMETLGPELALLLERVTLFDLGWMVLFILALEGEGKVRGSEAGTAVVSVWVLTTLTQWGFWLYLARLS